MSCMLGGEKRRRKRITYTFQHIPAGSTTPTCNFLCSVPSVYAISSPVPHHFPLNISERPVIRSDFPRGRWGRCPLGTASHTPVPIHNQSEYGPSHKPTPCGAGERGRGRQSSRQGVTIFQGQPRVSRHPSMEHETTTPLAIFPPLLRGEREGRGLWHALPRQQRQHHLYKTGT